MDKGTEARIDAITEHQIVRGWTIVSVPTSVRTALTDSGFEVVEQVRFTKLNPARRRDIAEVVQRRYHADIMDAAIPSNAQVAEAMARRGEWTDAKQRRMEDLQRSTGLKMSRLWAAGLSPDTDSYLGDLRAKVAELRTAVQESDWDDAQKAEYLAIFEDWYVWEPGTENAIAAARQKRPTYSADSDWSYLCDNAPKPEHGQLIADIDELKDKQRELIALNQERLELMELQVRHARIFSGTAESRQAHNEEMAQLYFTCERVDADGRPTGRLAKTFDALYEFPQPVISWLLQESMFFHYDVVPEARDYLETFGFTTADREPKESSGENESTAASPAPQSSSNDSAPPVPASSASAPQLVTT